MNNRHSLASCFPLCFGLIVAMGLVMGARAQDEPTRSITQIGEDLYRAQNNIHHAVFLVTDDGIILADPINTGFSTWLKSELDRRFGVPVRYVLYSHHHWDHASGGAVFEDTAQFVGHENMLNHIAMPPADTSLPVNASGQDENGNGQLERSEVSGIFESRFDLYDEDGNDAISGAEATRGALKEVRAPNLTYKDRLTISLGNKDVELIYTGNQTHTDDMSIIRFPDASAIFLVDWVSPSRLPFATLGTGMLEAWLNAIRLAEALEYDIAVGGHGVVGDKADVTAVRHYLEELRDQVATGIAAGRSMEELQASVLMEPYQSWQNYELWRALNVEGMYNLLTP